VKINRRPRSAYVFSDEVDAMVHLPDLAVSDHDKLPVGFLHDRQRVADKAQAPTPFDLWREFRGKRR
jgi:hypothetical protein